MLWHEQTWPRIQATDRNTPVVVPLGSVEQHGHHLPLMTDSIQVTTIAEAAEQQLKDRILLLPTLWLGCSHHHIDFPGTVSVLPTLYVQMIKSVADCILRAGFKRILFLNGHGGNRVPAGDALSELVAEDDRADDAFLVLSSWWELGVEGIRAEKHGMTSAGVSHACEYETSLILAIRPDLVQTKEIVQGAPAMANDWHHSEEMSRQRVSVYRRFARLTAAGSMGSPSKATVEKGSSLRDAVVGEVVAFLRGFPTWPEIARKGPQ